MSDDQAGPERSPDTTDAPHPRHHTSFSELTQQDDSVVWVGPKEGYGRSGDEPVRDRTRDIFKPATYLIVIGVLLIQGAFIASYVGAFHSPEPHGLNVAVVSHNGWQGYVANRLNKIPGHPVNAYAYTDNQYPQAKKELRDGKRQAIYRFDPNNKTDTLEVTSAQGASVSTAMEAIFRQVTADQKRELKTSDIMPVQKGDGRGLTPFYLVIGWLVGGYLMATAIGVLFAPRAHNFRRMLDRLVFALLYAVVSGLMGALIVDQWLGALTGHFWAIALIGMLLSFTVTVFTMGFEALLGVIGIGLAIFLFVVAGNPSAGGAYAYALLPEPWRTIGPWMPNGAGVDAVRSVVYEQNSSLGSHLIIIGWWLAVGLLVLLLVSNNTYWGRRRSTPPETDAAPPPAA